MNLTRAGALLLLCSCLVYETQGGLLDILKGGNTTHSVQDSLGGLLDVFKGDSNNKKDDHSTTVQPSKKKGSPSILESMNGLVSSVATGDRIKTLMVLVDVELGDKKLHPIGKFLLRCARKLLQWIHPLYLKLFPDKVDRGSVSGNMGAGAQGVMDTVKKAGKMAEMFGKMFASNYLS